MAAGQLIGAGLELAALQITAFRPQRGFYPGPKSSVTGIIQAMCTIDEEHDDDLVITQHPVQQGATIADHAFKRPTRVTVRAGWSNSPNGGGAIGLIQSASQAFSQGLGGNFIQQVYNQLLALQSERIPFTIYTGKRIYKNMLMSSLVTRSDASNENSMIVTMRCEEIIIAVLANASVPSDVAALANAQSNQVTTNTGDTAAKLQPNDSMAQNLSVPFPGIRSALRGIGVPVTAP